MNGKVRRRFGGATCSEGSNKLWEAQDALDDGRPWQ